MRLICITAHVKALSQRGEHRCIIVADPHGGVFLSEDFPHEVLPDHRDDIQLRGGFV